jgi:hypothetical protein
MSDPRRRAVITIGVIAIVIGFAGALNGATSPVFEAPGRSLLRFMAINLFGGLFSVAIGIVAIAAARRANRTLLLLCGAAFVAAALVNLVGIDRSFNVFGGHASLASVFLCFGTGFVAIALTPELEDEGAGDA